MPRKTGRLKSIMSQSAAELSAASLSEAKSQYNYLRKVIRERSKTFAKRGKQGAFDRQYGITPIPSLRGLSESEVKAGVKSMVRKLTGSEATLTGLLNVNERKAQNIRNWFDTHLDNPLNDAQFDQIGRFLGDMQKRQGEMWKYVSDDFIEIVDDPDVQHLANISAEKGLKLTQLMKNFDYWKAHIDDLEKAEIPEASRGYLVPSDYIKSLKLPSIKKWRKGEA